MPTGDYDQVPNFSRRPGRNESADAGAASGGPEPRRVHPPPLDHPAPDDVAASQPTLVTATEEMTGGPGSRGEEEWLRPSGVPGPAPSCSPAKDSVSFEHDVELDSIVIRDATTARPAEEEADTLPQQHDDETPRRQASPASPEARESPRGDDAATHAETAHRDSQQRLNEYRERLARQMEAREFSPRAEKPLEQGRTRVSPIQEENSNSPSPQPQPLGSDSLNTSSSTTTTTTTTTTTSTESGQTIRGPATPSLLAGTPSYPFPRMASYGSLPPGGHHRPFTALSPTVLPDGSRRPAPDPLKSHDTLASNPSTPASNMTFLPPGCSQVAADQRTDYPSPNLYELTLMLSAEPGLEAWWNTVVQIMVDVYKAERVTLAIPADPTDIENVPWGQKATYNAHGEDDLSLAYLARGSSLVPSSMDGTPVGNLSHTDALSGQQEPPRPALQSRHSFTSYEQNQRAASDEPAVPHSPRRPALLGRSKSHHPSTMPGRAAAGDGHTVRASLNQETLEQHDALAEEQEIPSWEAPFTAPREGHGKVLNVLQALNYEADPLIDHNGVLRILERGRVVALTRTYPYLNPEPGGAKKPSDGRAGAGAKPPDPSRPKPRKPRSDSLSKLSSLLGGATMSSVSSRVPRAQASERKPTLGSRLDDEPPKPPTPKYEEYEQAPPSPWSQSPAPSPAVRADPAENPFFTDAMVDEESFNPSSAPADYSAMMPPEAIGVDNSWTVLHVPLTHVLLSKPNPPFRLDPSLMEQKMSARKAADPAAVAGLSPERPGKEKHAPIAILSILSPIIPYPSNLRHSLEHLAPHLATTFSLCRHYTNLETELSGLQKRRPHAVGFGALGPDGRPLAADPAALAATAGLPAEDTASRGSLAGSMTSPSEYSAPSGPSRSAAGSPCGTPSWEPASLGFVMDKRALASSPAQVIADSYFSSAPKGPANAGQQRARRNSRETPPAEKRSSLRLSGGKAQPYDPATVSPAAADARTSSDSARPGQPEEAVLTGALQQRRPSSREKKEQPLAGAPAQTDVQKKRAGTPGSATPHRHTQLHSYGADFASTFQSLPPSSTIGRAAPHATPPARTGSIAHTGMTPPSDRLKGLILDSLPAHVFVALPQTGEIVWVNSRFLTYRGQTSSDLAADPWGSIHPEERDEYLRAWSQCVRTGEQFSRTVRIRRFDGAYRWFYARAVASKDKRGVIMQFLGSYMDIHDQHIAEVKAARQEEILASEAKHRLLANLIPQIIFTATEDEGITFANEQWLSYTGQDFDGVLGLGFMDYVHPDDLASCRIPLGAQPSRDLRGGGLKGHGRSFSADASAPRQPGGIGIGIAHRALARNSSSDGRGDVPAQDLPAAANLSELAKKGVIKVSTDSSGRLSYTTEIRLRSKSGEYRWHLIRCVEIDNVDFGNGVSSYFGSATDINDLKLLETKLKEAMDTKGRFLSNMSHEIRTPLIGISGMVSFLQDTTLNEEQRDYTNTIQTSANSLLMIINDILDLSKVDAGMMKLNHEWFHTRSLIEDVNELVSTMAIAKRLELNYVVEEDVPAWVKGDKVRIRQVLLNVIGNAIKFTNQGEVFSKCRVVAREGARLGPDKIMLEFSIIDTGRGFSKEEAELIFKPFSQIDGSSTRQHGGSGLGLVISRQLVELHGGKMEGTAVPGEGSIFTFTAKFGLPTEDDHPDATAVPQSTPGFSRDTPFAPVPLPSVLGLPAPSVSPVTTEAASTSVGSPAGASSGSSDVSGSSGRSRLTGRTSVSSVNAGLVRFSQAARASGQDLSQMKLEMPSRKSSPATTPTPTGQEADGVRGHHPPPMYSILIICTQTHSREATTKHIEMTLPKDIPRQITTVATVEEAEPFIGGHEAVRFTHIVVNLPSAEEIISLMDKMAGPTSALPGNTTILILSDSVQRQAVSKLVAGTKYEDMFSGDKVTYIYKPVKPSRFAVIFDPAKERDLSIDHNRSSAQRLVEDQRQSYVDMERRMGGKGYKVLLVEDNPVNQKVLQKYLRRVGLTVELAADGVECTDMVFEKGWGYYSLILCDLHMPRKDGYQACREVRAWEAQGGFGSMPIIALSANVMSDVQEKCIEAGFNDYVTKPVDFIDLSRALAKFF